MLTIAITNLNIDIVDSLKHDCLSETCNYLNKFVKNTKRKLCNNNSENILSVANALKCIQALSAANLRSFMMCLIQYKSTPYFKT